MLLKNQYQISTDMEWELGIDEIPFYDDTRKTEEQKAYGDVQ